MINTADRFYGEAAQQYDDNRADRKRWCLERKAVASLIEGGPILDCPVGNGRLIPLWRKLGIAFEGIDISADMIAEARRRYSSAHVIERSVFDLSCGRDAFAGVVSTRFLSLFDIGDVRRVLRIFEYAAPVTIASVRLADIERFNVRHKFYTHSESEFLNAVAICGLQVDRRSTICPARYGRHEIFRLKRRDA